MAVHVRKLLRYPVKVWLRNLQSYHFCRSRNCCRPPLGGLNRSHLAYVIAGTALGHKATIDADRTSASEDDVDVRIVGSLFDYDGPIVEGNDLAGSNEPVGQLCIRPCKFCD